MNKNEYKQKEQYLIAAAECRKKSVFERKKSFEVEISGLEQTWDECFFPPRCRFKIAQVGLHLLQRINEGKQIENTDVTRIEKWCEVYNSGSVDEMKEVILGRVEDISDKMEY
jgi:hypothetical protein